MIEAENLTKRYGAIEAVSGVSFHIDRGEVVGLLGPNGAGKTTIMRILTCYHYPSSGTARIGSHDIFTEPEEIRESVGYLPENAPLYQELTAAEYLQFIAGARGLRGRKGVDAVSAAVEQCGIGSVLHRTIATLSKGYRQRVGLAQAILHSPEILILDEPTSGLDPNQIVEVRRLLSQLGKEKTVILSTHILAEVEAVCGRVLILNEGRIVAEGAPKEIAEGLSGESRYRLEIRAKMLQKSDVQRAPGARSVVGFERGPAGTYFVEVVTSKESDEPEKLFDWAVANGYKILSMAPVTMSLEAVFSRLTTGVRKKGSRG